MTDGAARPPPMPPGRECACSCNVSRASSSRAGIGLPVSRDSAARMPFCLGVSSKGVCSIGSLYQKKVHLRNTPTARTVQTVHNSGRMRRNSPVNRRAADREGGVSDLLIACQTDTPNSHRFNWLQVFRRADAALLGSERRQPHQTRAVREEKYVGHRASVGHRYAGERHVFWSVRC